MVGVGRLLIRRAVGTPAEPSQLTRTQLQRPIDVNQCRTGRHLQEERAMIRPPATVVRRVVSGVIVLVILLLSSVPINAMPHAHAHDHGATQKLLSVSPQADCQGKSHSPHDMTAEACCLGSSCVASDISGGSHHLIRIAWSPVYYWTADSDGMGIRPSPDLGPPITLG